MKRNRYHRGIIAQDIEQLINDTNIDFGGFHNGKLIGGEDELTLGHTEFIGPMVKMIQDLGNIVKGTQARIEILEHK